MRKCTTQGKIEYEGESFSWVALPHENGKGFSYNIQMSRKPRDVIHIDTKHGTIFNEDDLIAIREYFKLVRHKRKNDN
jgi:hypothetical protein